MREADWSKVLGWPGYRVYRHEIDEPGKRLKLWVRRKRGNRKLICSGCGRKLNDAYDSYEREVRDLPFRRSGSFPTVCKRHEKYSHWHADNQSRKRRFLSVS